MNLDKFDRCLLISLIIIGIIALPFFILINHTDYENCVNANTYCEEDFHCNYFGEKTYDYFDCDNKYINKTINKRRCESCFYQWTEELLDYSKERRNIFYLNESDINKSGIKETIEWANENDINIIISTNGLPEWLEQNKTPCQTSGAIIYFSNESDEDIISTSCKLNKTKYIEISSPETTKNWISYSMYYYNSSTTTKNISIILGEKLYVRDIYNGKIYTIDKNGMITPNILLKYGERIILEEIKIKDANVSGDDDE